VNALVSWMQKDLFRWLEIAVAACIWIGFPVLMVMFFFKSLRKWVGVILFNMSYLTGFACWVFSFIVTYHTLGGFWLVVGLVFLGVGIFPLAVIGTIIHGLGSTLPDLLFAIALMLVPRAVGRWIVKRQSPEISE
jgi:hypothetical protein